VKDNIVPKYADDEAYSVLAKICDNAGLKIEYTDNMSYNGIAENMKILAESDTNTRKIHMPISYEYLSYEQPSILLGHEIAHFLLDEFYNTRYDNELLERECDKTGIILFKLAELIALHNEDLKFNELTNQK
jgi:hypothetical protein